MKLKIQIKNRFTGKIIFELETENNTIAKTINEYVKLAAEKYERADLSRANLSGANLSRANLSGADLSRADLSRANLSGANLSESDLSGANLSRANLSGADLSESNLSGADLSGADLSESNLSESNLSESNLSESDLSRANLSGANLDSIKYDFFGRMLVQKNEISALREKVINGEINGSSYEGKCACFVGTIANIKHVSYTNLDLRANSNSSTECWFMGISEGMKPETHEICKITLGWIDEFLTLIK